jgi:hypothetical protein
LQLRTACSSPSVAGSNSTAGALAQHTLSRQQGGDAELREGLPGPGPGSEADQRQNAQLSYNERHTKLLIAGGETQITKSVIFPLVSMSVNAGVKWGNDLICQDHHDFHDEPSLSVYSAAGGPG